MFGGSACPKPIGDKLVEGGVHLISHYGTTETGQLMTSFRERRDKAWDFVRVAPNLKPFIRWELRGPNIFELVILEGWPSKVATNRDDGSYATKDLFEPHTTIPHAWRYYARLDDTLVLDNGEKANPLLMEGVAREHRLVAEAIVFGENRPRLGIFIIPTVTAQDVSKEQLVDALCPAIEKANDSVPASGRLSRDMIHGLASDAPLRKTDKGTVIRAAFYRDYKDTIDAVYIEDEGNGTLQLEGSELVEFLRNATLEVLALRDSSILIESTDLFSFGMDSLQASALRRKIVTEVDVGPSKLSQNFVFENPSLEKMATELARARSRGPVTDNISTEDRMTALIERHSHFSKHVPGGTSSSGADTWLVTGATGSLGAHVASILANTPSISHVFCPVRASSVTSARDRVRQSLQGRRVYHTMSSEARRKLVPLPSTFHEDRLGLNPADYDEITKNLAGVVHCAWSVNFNYTLESFEDCIQGTRNLIHLCLDSQRTSPAHFNFCSSVSAVAATPGGVAPEGLPESLSYAQGMGYARSKLVTEHICINAHKQSGLRSRVLRVGQIIADTKHGVWNATEAILLIFHGARTIKAVPALDENPSWLPVDVVAQSIVEIASSEAESEVVNVANHDTFHWTRDLIPMLREAGLKFDELPQREWIARLRDSNKDPAANSPIKLFCFFEKKYDHDEKRSGVRNLSDRARHYSPTLAAAPSLTGDVVSKFVNYFESSCWIPKRSAHDVGHVIVFAGPCGSGKTTAAIYVAEALNIPMIEGDNIHTDEAKARMSSGQPLTDEDRWTWLARVGEAAITKLEKSAYRAVAVTCSALRVGYRDALRKLNQTGKLRVSFILLSGEEDSLKKRVTLRHEIEGYYMKADMVDSQLDLFEKPTEDEFDVIPVDSSRPLEEVLDEVLSVTRDVCVALC